MKTRAITGFFFVLVMVGSLLLGKWLFVVFYSLLAITAQKEFYTLISKPDTSKKFTGWLLYGLLICIGFTLFFLQQIELEAILLFLGALVFLFLQQLFLKQATQPFQTLAYGFLGVVYLIIPFISFIGLGFLKGYYAYEIPLGFLILLWSNDTGAYLSGRSFGRRKLFERISPNKTWEGFLGGLILAIGVALNLEQYFGSLARWQWVSVAFIISIFGTWGDLVESMLKRSLQVKDSGTILPGHGGLMDRFDGLLLSAPIVYIFLTLIL